MGYGYGLFEQNEFILLVVLFVLLVVVGYEYGFGEFGRFND